MVRETRPWLVVILVIIVVLMSESAATTLFGTMEDVESAATLSGFMEVMEVEQFCENQCQSESFRVRQVTSTGNTAKENCKDKCMNAYYSTEKMMNTLQDSKEEECRRKCHGDIRRKIACRAVCMSRPPALMMKTLQEEANNAKTMNTLEDSKEDECKSKCHGPLRMREACKARCMSKPPGLMMKTIQEEASNAKTMNTLQDSKEDECRRECAHTRLPLRFRLACENECLKRLPGLVNTQEEVT